MTRSHRLFPILSATSMSLLLGCSVGTGDNGFESFGSAPGAGTGDAGATDGGGQDGASDGDGSAGDDDRGPLLDVAHDDGPDTAGDGGPPMAECTVSGDELDSFPGCNEEAPPDSFEPEVQWTWQAPFDARFSFVTPLVANLTDDNGDGAIDLCDIPDIVVLGYPSLFQRGYMYILDGATGTQHFRIDQELEPGTTPAIGDIDHDGLPEIVAHAPGGLIAFNHDGSVLWTSTETAGNDAIALADLDNDGDVEIIAGYKVLEHDGTLRWSHPEGDAGASWIGSATTAADLDGDGSLEVVMGPSAWFADGELFWLNEEVSGGFVQIGDLDDDPQPEVLVTNQSGFSILEHDGTIKVLDAHPTDDAPEFNNWVRPASIHDFDGDGKSEFALSSKTNYSVFEGDGSILWSTLVADDSGTAAGTAFDFLGDGVAEAMYGDEDHSMIFDGLSGELVLQTPRTSRTLIEYPVVADIDNDGSAEILVTASDSIHEGVPPIGFTVQAIRDKDDRWIQARRIWNQHTYHVTNVREDGTIPQYEQPNWETLNTFRTNAQIEAGGICKPHPEG